MAASFARKPLFVVLMALLPVACVGEPGLPAAAPSGSPTAVQPTAAIVAPAPTNASQPQAVVSIGPYPGASPSNSASAAAPVAPAATIALLAGVGAKGFEGDGGRAINAKFNTPWGVAFDLTGDLWVADSANSRLRKVSRAGDISTVVGTAVSGFNGDNLADRTVTLSQPYSVAFSPAGNVFIADTLGSRVRRLDVTTRLVTTVAGNGSGGFRGDGGQATQATLSNPTCVAVDASETLYIADTGNQVIRKVTPGGVISTVVGTATGGFNGDNKQGPTVSLRYPEAVALDKAGNLYIADGGNSRIRKMTPDGMVRTIVGDGTAGFAGDGGPATAARINRPIGMVIAADGTLYFADANNNRVRMVRPDGIILTVAGSAATASGGDDGPALAAGFGRPTGLALDTDGSLIVSDTGSAPYDHKVRKITFTK